MSVIKRNGQKIHYIKKEVPPDYSFEKSIKYESAFLLLLLRLSKQEYDLSVERLAKLAFESKEETIKSLKEMLKYRLNKKTKVELEELLKIIESKKDINEFLKYLKKMSNIKNILI